MDILVLENCILYKDEQKGIDAAKQENYREEFPLD